MTSLTIATAETTTIDAVRNYIIEEFVPGTPSEHIDAGMDLLNSGIIDSLGLLKLLAWLETTFDIAIDDADLDPENFRDLATIAGFVERPRNETAHP